jgi:hypothetical protein
MRSHTRVLLGSAALVSLVGCAGDGIPPLGAPPSATASATHSVTPTRTGTPLSPTVAATGPLPPTGTATPTATPTPSPTPTATSAFATIQDTIFNPNCLSSGCHNARDRAGDLALEAATSHAQLVNHEPDNLSARREGLLRVDPGDPANSFLLRKLEGPPAAQGSRMPLGQPPLAAADIDLIRAWIAAGAPP